MQKPSISAEQGPVKLQSEGHLSNPIPDRTRHSLQLPTLPDGLKMCLELSACESYMKAWSFASAIRCRQGLEAISVVGWQTGTRQLCRQVFLVTGVVSLANNGRQATQPEFVQKPSPLSFVSLGKFAQRCAEGSWTASVVAAVPS